MSEERRQILNLLAQGKINADEAERLIEALGEGETKSDNKSYSGCRAKYLRVLVEPKEGHDGEHVNIKIPLQIIRAGVKLGKIIPGDAKSSVSRALSENGIEIDLNELKLDKIEKILAALSDTSIDVDSDRERVKISTE
nr:hypothetical protein [candidate division Zixibacteria bacterium]